MATNTKDVTKVPNPENLMGKQHWEKVTDLPRAREIIGRFRSSVELDPCSGLEVGLTQRVISPAAKSSSNYLVIIFICQALHTNGSLIRVISTTTLLNEYTNHVCC